MKPKMLLFASFVLLYPILGCSQSKEKTDKKKTNTMEYHQLTPEEEAVIVHKHTERPFTGEYNDFDKAGTYVCKRCGAPLYKSEDKFKSHCGWPSFDDEIPGAVRRLKDADGMRTEIVCARCGAHLGHVFLGEGFTSKNTRHCVNSISLKFIPQSKATAVTDTAIVAGGCFWGVEYYMQQMPGVLSTEVGYIGGNKENPTYREVCTHTTGHAEAVRIVFDPKKTSYEKILKTFFEIHDPTEINRQGPDIGTQYRTAVFYLDDTQRQTAQRLIARLKALGLNVATEVTKASTFWKAESEHEDYYKRHGTEPYCHRHTPRNW